MKTVEEVCKLIEQYQLMTSKDYATMRTRWFKPERKEVADVEQFRKWAVMNRYLTDFVAKVLLGRKSDQLVLNQYRLQDQLISGPMAGAYLALDVLDRPVAIEVLSADSAADKPVLMAFQQAVYKAKDVQHPNVGRILDVGEAHGFHYMVKEYAEGQTLEDVLQRRKKVPYLQATRLLAHTLAGLDALHAKGVPAGDLTADCLLLAPAGKDAPNQRTVKILHAGVKRKLFDDTAIGRSIMLTTGIPDDLQLASSCVFQISQSGAVNPADDIFRLGCIFYRALTGQAPFSDRDLPQPSRPARPIAELASDVPETLCQIIDEMIDIDPAKRPQKAAHVAKALRVFLATEEQSREVSVEDQVVAPSRAAPVENVEEEAPEDVEEQEEQEEEAESRQAGLRKVASSTGTPWEKAVAMWEDVKLRDIFYFAGGAFTFLLAMLLVQFIIGIRLTYIAGLATGMTASYFVNQYVRWRQEKQQQA